MIRRPPRSTRTDTLVPYTTLVRSLWSNFPAIFFTDYKISRLKIEEMGQHRTTGRSMQAWIDALIHFLDHFRNAGAVMATQMAHDLSLPMFAMPHHRSHPALRIFNWFAVGWIVDHIIPAQQLLHARHISRHRSDERRVGKECDRSFRTRWSPYL